MTFLEQLDRWHEDDEHEKIVDAILALPPEGRGYDLTGRLARALNNLSREAEGLAVLDGVAEEGENDPLWHYRRGYALYYLDREAEAKAEFERAAALDPGDADSREFIRMCDAILEREAAGDSPELYGEAELEALDRFITGRFGPYESVFHELASPDIHVDICVIPPRPERNYYTLVTMGMGAHRMDVPEGLRDRKLERAEMVVCLPPDWPLSDHDERWYWPLRWLKILARLPGEQDTWLGWGHTVSNEEPFADNTGLCAVILDVPRAFGGEAFCCPLPGGDEVNFYQYVPIYQEELDYKLSHSAEALFARLEGETEVLDPERENTCEDLDGDGEEGPSFRERSDAFWEWFGEQEETLSDMVEHREAHEAEEVIGLLDQGVGLISPDLHFNVGGDHEFTFTAEGGGHLFYLMPWLVARMPGEYEGKWHFSPWMRSSKGKQFSLSIHGVEAGVDEVRVSAEYDPSTDRFGIRFWHGGLCALDGAKGYNAFFLLMENCIGEGLSYLYIGEVARAEGPEEGMFPLAELEDRMADVLRRAGKKMFTRPDRRYTVYQVAMDDRDAPRYDITIGDTCWSELVNAYYRDDTQLPDALEACGARAVYLSFPVEDVAEGQSPLDVRHELEELIESEVLGERGSGEELGILLGTAMGSERAYIDLLLYDEAAFWDEIGALLGQYPYDFRISDFRPGGDGEEDGAF